MLEIKKMRLQLLSLKQLSSGLKLQLNLIRRPFYDVCIEDGNTLHSVALLQKKNKSLCFLCSAPFLHFLDTGVMTEIKLPSFSKRANEGLWIKTAESKFLSLFFMDGEWST